LRCGSCRGDNATLLPLPPAEREDRAVVSFEVFEAREEPKRDELSKNLI